MVEKISSPGVERKEMCPSGLWRTLWTLPWACQEKSSSWTSAMSQQVRTISTNPKHLLEETVSQWVWSRSEITVLLSVTDFKVDAVNWPGTSEEIFSSVTETDTCPTRTSVLALSVVCAMLLVIYICTMFYFCMRKVILQNQKVSLMRPKREDFICSSRNRHWGTPRYLEDKKTFESFNWQESQWILPLNSSIL